MLLMSYMTPDELFGPEDPERARKLAYVAAAHSVRSSLFARLKGQVHRSSLAANAIWAGGHWARTKGMDPGVELAPATLDKMRGGYELVSRLDKATLETLQKAAKGGAAKTTNKEQADVAFRVISALGEILSSRASAPRPVAAPPASGFGPRAPEPPPLTAAQIRALPPLTDAEIDRGRRIGELAERLISSGVGEDRAYDMAGTEIDAALEGGEVG